MSNQTDIQTIILTVDEFLDKDFATDLLHITLQLVCNTIPEIKHMVYNSDNLKSSISFADIEELDAHLYERIRIELTLEEENKVGLRVFLQDQTE